MTLRPAMSPEEMKADRLNKGLSIRQFAAMVGVKEQVIRRLESGGGISPANAKRLADHFDVKVTDLFPLDEAA